MKCASYSPPDYTASGLHVHAYAPECATGSIHSLTQDTFLPKNYTDFSRLLQSLCEQSATVLPAIEEHIDALKETYIAALHSLLQEHGVSPEKRLVIGLDANRQLYTCNTEHPEREHIDALLAQQQGLALALYRIASESMLFDSLSHLAQLFAYYASEANTYEFSAPEAYRVCLKGPLSHFYFSS